MQQENGHQADGVRSDVRSLLAVGSRIDYCGTRMLVAAVGIVGGERYYWLTHRNGLDVAMVPAFVLEARIPSQSEVAS
jgi:hypothetical protein